MSLRRYLAKRVMVALFIIWAIVSLNFSIFRVLSPAKPYGAAGLGISTRVTPDVRRRFAELWGLTKPIYIQYLVYIKNMFTWNFGISFHALTPIADEMSWRLSVTVLLLGSALVATILLGITAGIFAASRRGSKVDVLTISGGLITWGIPIFFIQLLSLMWFSYHFYIAFGFRVFPLMGITSWPTGPVEPLIYMADMAWHLAQPLLTLVLAGFGSWALMTRNVLLDALTQDYIVTARAKGVSERAVLYRHAFRGTLPPIVTMMAMSIAGIVTGSVITEFIFILPGIGRWYLDGLVTADFPVIESVLFIYAVLMVFANLVSDFIYGVVDPRIRIGESYQK